jgi:uracil-DNA glycosylase family protein
MIEALLAGEADFDGWRTETRRLVAAGHPPEAVVFRVGAEAPDLIAEAKARTAAGHEAAPERQLHVPRRFVELAREVVCHRDPERFAGMRWSILTPDASTHWDLRSLSFSPGARRADVPSDDALEAYWRTYYSSIFNPARLNTAAMRVQMPVKYWKNLPEATLIRPLTSAAGQRVEGMMKAPPSNPPLAARPSRAQSPAHEVHKEKVMPLADLARIKQEAADCRRCPLWEPATQTVFGEGPADAALMLVGEQPGDKEDVAGRPFVGPAGAVLDRALADAGIERERVYVSNAVKHFKFLIRSTRRLHQKPSVFEIDTCRYWLDAEIEAVAPRVIVAMGATAGRGVFARDVKIGRERGRIVELRQGQRGLVTVHPSYLLRLPDEEAKEREYARFVADLKLAREALAA